MRSLRFGAALCAVVLANCQSTDFEPVKPSTLAISNVKCISREQRPNVMLLVDRSGSMSDYADPGCTGSACPTRIFELQSAMGAFLTTFGDKARMGVTFFPQGSGCALTTSTAVQIPADDATSCAVSANAVKNAIDSIAPSGGTPTADAIRFAAQNPALHDSKRENYIVLLTDGVPNCNAALDGNTCTCTTTSCSANPVQCLNDDETVAAIREAYLAYGIKTLVIGFGIDTSSGVAAQTLQAMAQAGAYQRECEEAADCGGSACDLASGTCEQAYCDTSTALELGAELTKFVNSLNPCKIDLTATPSDPALVAVKVADSLYSPGADTWQYRPPPAGTGLGQVELVGDLCALAKSGTASNPVQVQVQSLQSF